MFELLVPTGKCPSFSCHLDTVQSYLKNWKIAQIRLACGNICDKLLWLVTDAGGPSHCGSAILSKVIPDCRQILDEHKPDGMLANSIPPWLCFCFSSCLGFSHWWLRSADWSQPFEPELLLVRKANLQSGVVLETYGTIGSWGLAGGSTSMLAVFAVL